MKKIGELLGRFKKAEEFFADENIEMEHKKKWVKNYHMMLEELTKECERLKLDTEALRNEMLKAGIQCE